MTRGTDPRRRSCCSRSTPRAVSRSTPSRRAGGRPFRRLRRAATQSSSSAPRSRTVRKATFDTSEVGRLRLHSAPLSACTWRAVRRWALLLQRRRAALRGRRLARHPARLPHSLGPIELTALTLTVGVKNGEFPVGITTDIKAALGPLSASVEEIGRAPLRDRGRSDEETWGRSSVTLRVPRPPKRRRARLIDAGVVRRGRLPVLRPGERRVRRGRGARDRRGSDRQGHRPHHHQATRRLERFLALADPQRRVRHRGSARLRLHAARRGRTRGLEPHDEARRADAGRSHRRDREHHVPARHHLRTRPRSSATCARSSPRSRGRS